jgi:adenine/guanine phosphoribosyltransferase-like PRPP-binding protein
VGLQQKSNSTKYVRKLLHYFSGHLAELYYDHNVDAVIGPGCSESITGAARLAEYLGLPIVTGVGDLVVRNTYNDDMYETLTILSYNIGKLSGI